MPRRARHGGVCAGQWLKHRDATGICAGLQVSFEADGPARMELLCPEDVSRVMCRAVGISWVIPCPSWDGSLQGRGLEEPHLYGVCCAGPQNNLIYLHSKCHRVKFSLQRLS